MGDRQAQNVRPTPPETPGTTSPLSPIATSRDDAADRPKKARRTFLTQNACTRCRQKKSKCDGKRPTCGRCEKHATSCEYDVAHEGMTRMQNLQTQLGNKTEDYDKLKQLFNAMQHGSDHEATEILARLRLGASIDHLLNYTDEGEVPTSAQSFRSTSIDAEQGPVPGYSGQWSTSPMQDGAYWPDGESASRQPSQSSASQFSGSRSDTEPGIAIRQQDVQSNYYPPPSAHGAPSQQVPNAPFNAVQWQPQERPGNVGPYYTEPPRESRKHGKRPQDR